MDSLDEVGKALQVARLRAQISQADLAARAGLSRVTVSRMENAANADMSLAALMRALSALGHELQIVQRGHRRTLEDVLAEQRQDLSAQDHS